MAGPSPTPPIFTYIDARTPVYCHEHIAILHRGRASEVKGAEFLAEGLRRGHWCCYLAPSVSHTAMRARLLGLGLDGEQCLNNRALQFPPEQVDAEHWLDWGKKFLAAAEIARAPAVRWLEEGVGTKPAGLPVSQFFVQHSRLNYLTKQYPSLALCHYDTERMGIPHLFSAIAVHRHLLVEAVLVRDNPFYIPGEKLVAMTPEDRERDLRDVFREVGFDLQKLLLTLAGYGRLQRSMQAGS